MAKVKTYIVSVDNNKEFCGVGAGGAHFAHGEATITNDRLANWFKEHPGYTVKEVEETPDLLSGMTKDELKEFAASNGIDLTDVPDKKTDILNAIKAAGK